MKKSIFNFRSLAAEAKALRLDRKTVSMLIEWVKSPEFLCSDRSLDAIAEDFGLSKDQLSWFFRKRMGMPFYSFRKNLRMKEMKRLMLEYPEESISSLARSVGYRDRGNFRRDFLQEEGMNPTEWREIALKRQRSRR